MKLSKTAANLLLVFVTILWGSTYIFNKMVVNAGMQSGTINAVRGCHVLWLAESSSFTAN